MGTPKNRSLLSWITSDCAKWVDFLGVSIERLLLEHQVKSRVLVLFCCCYVILTSQSIGSFNQRSSQLLLTKGSACWCRLINNLTNREKNKTKTELYFIAKWIRTLLCTIFRRISTFKCYSYCGRDIENEIQNHSKPVCIRTTAVGWVGSSLAFFFLPTLIGTFAVLRSIASYIWWNLSQVYSTSSQVPLLIIVVACDCRNWILYVKNLIGNK